MNKNEHESLYKIQSAYALPLPIQYRHVILPQMTKQKRFRTLFLLSHIYFSYKWSEIFQ
jgi:hypothetical protein